MRYGGKVRLAEQIVQHLPRARMYVEPFFGAGGLFFAVPETAYQVEIVNDLDHSIVTFFRVLRERPAELRAALEATPYSREEFRLALERADDSLEEARRVWIRARQSFAGVGRNWVAPRPKDPLPFRPYQGEANLPRLDEVARRLRAVAIECGDGIALIERHALPGVALYIDPPYLPETRHTHGNDAYRHELDAAGHQRLLDACSAAAVGGAHVAISGYRSDLYDFELGAWRRVDMTTRAGHRGKIGTRTECLWMSYPTDVEIGYRGDMLDLEARP